MYKSSLIFILNILYYYKVGHFSDTRLSGCTRKKKERLIVVGLILTTWCVLFQADGSKTIVVPNYFVTAPSYSKLVSGVSGLDGPKIRPNNVTSFEWWYFDAVSEDGLTSVVIAFYLATDLGFPLLGPGSAISVDIFVSFDDGTILFYPLNNLPGYAGSATVVTDGDGSSGCWASTGFRWTGTGNMSQYVVSINSPSLGIKGSLTLDSVRSIKFCSHFQTTKFSHPIITIG